MRPSLSLLVRSVLLEESHEVLESEAAADEAVDVKPAQIKTSYGGDKTAEKAHQYVNTEKWRDAVMRTYSFLDKHDAVGDVIVIPIAIDFRSFRNLLPTRVDDRLRSWVTDRHAAGETLVRIGGDRDDIPRVQNNAITVVPLVGMYGRSADTLPSAWMLVHGMFDRGMQDLPACREASQEIRGLLKAIDPRNDSLSPIPLLLNCGWSENSFHMVTAAIHHTADKRGTYYRDVLSHKLSSPVVGKKYKSHEDVSIRDEMPASTIERSLPRISGLKYVQRPHGDIVSEIMTIAATKPSGFQPVLSRLPQLSDDVMLGHVFHSKEPRFIALRDRVWEVFEKSEDPHILLAPADRKMIEETVLDDLEEIKMLTHDLRDRLVQDLLGKVIFVTGG
jgi:hypothetical protein